MVVSGEISVVVQGAVAGKPTDPPEKRLTDRCLRSVRRHLPDAEIILSTWRGSDVAGLTFDKLVFSDDPGATPLDVRRTPNNINRQIVSTSAGLKIVERPFAVKLRTDFELLGDRFLSYFGKYSARAAEARIFRERVVTSTIFSINPRRFAAMPFHPSDWFFFGLTEDLRNLWDIPPAVEPGNSRWCGDNGRDHIPFLAGRTARFAPEQTMWLGLLRKYGEYPCNHMTDVARSAIELTELTFANNLVLETPRRLGLKYLKGRRGSIWDPESFAAYTHADWRRMYRRYCDPKAAVPWFDGRWYVNAYLYFWYSIGRGLLSAVRRPPADPFADSNLNTSNSGR